MLPSRLGRVLVSLLGWTIALGIGACGAQAGSDEVGSGGSVSEGPPSGGELSGAGSGGKRSGGASSGGLGNTGGATNGGVVSVGGALATAGSPGLGGEPLGEAPNFGFPEDAVLDELSEEQRKALCKAYVEYEYGLAAGSDLYCRTQAHAAASQGGSPGAMQSACEGAYSDCLPTQAQELAEAKARDLSLCEERGPYVFGVGLPTAYPTSQCAGTVGEFERCTADFYRATFGLLLPCNEYTAETYEPSLNVTVPTCVALGNTCSVQ
jgi:hypothetical protein